MVYLKTLVISSFENAVYCFSSTDISEILGFTPKSVICFSLPTEKTNVETDMNIQIDEYNKKE